MYEILDKLLKEKGLTAYKLAKDTGVSTATLTSWKQGKYVPKLDKLQIIAEYLGVTVEYLTTGNEIDQTSEPTLTKKDKQDIAKHVDSILSQLDSGEALMFDGEPMNEETKALLRASLENSVEMAKITAKKKFTPKKYR
nr:MAG TPA: Repressor protein CI [Caudoviricetes sp.]